MVGVIHAARYVPESTGRAGNRNAFKTLPSLTSGAVGLRYALAVQRVGLCRTGADSVDIGHALGTGRDAGRAVPLLT